MKFSSVDWLSLTLERMWLLFLLVLVATQNRQNGGGAFE